MITRLFISICMLLAAGSTAAQDNTLFSEANYRSIVADHRAFKIGDVLTVVIQEVASASTTIDSGAQKRSGLDVQIDPIQGSGSGAGVALSNESQGGGRMQRTGRLIGHISVSVKDVSPNGDLLVEGDQVVDINGEVQTIKLIGRVRLRDVDAANMVSSTRVADARITFSGEGFLADKGRPSWWDKFLGFFGF